ncbi:MAG: TonB family protein, partial [Bdellovibrionota bacterium]
YEVTIDQTEVAASEVAPVEEVTPTPAPPEPPVVAEAPAPKPAPVAKPVAQKPAPKKAVVAAAKPAKKIVVMDLSEPTTEPQAAIEVNETMNELVEATDQSQEQIAAVTAPSEETVVKSEDIKEEVAEPAQELAPAKEQETAEEVAERKAEETASTQPEKALEKIAATAAPIAAQQEATQASAQKSGSPAGQDEVPATKEAPQNFLTLKQAPGNRAPSYPKELRKQQVQGKGQLKYFVNKDGRVGQMELTQSTGSAELDKAAMDSFANYKFVPGQEGYTVHNFEFSLKGPAEPEPRRLRTSYNK